MLATYGIVLSGVFLGGMVDAIAGGGGLLSLPAYFAAGLPPHLAIGTNKLSAALGTSFATFKYYRKNLIDGPVVALAAVFAMLGAIAGSRTVVLLNPGFLRYLLLALVPCIAIFSLLNRDLGMTNHSASIPLRRKRIFTALAGLLIGFYDGFFGPGTGSFYILFFTLVLRYDFAVANGNTKVLNLSSNLASLVAFIFMGKISYSIGLPAIVCGIAGNLLGARLVIKNGNRLIRPIFVTVLLLLLAKIVYDLIW